jgi:hypothetical protein
VPGIVCSVARQHHNRLRRRRRRRLVLFCSPLGVPLLSEINRFTFLSFFLYLCALNLSTRSRPLLLYLSCSALLTSAIVVSHSGSPYIWSLAILRIDKRFRHLRCSSVPTPSFPVFASSRLSESKYFGLPQLAAL